MLIIKPTISIWLALLCIGCEQKDEKPYYFEHKLKKPVAFEQGNITTTNGISFSKDGNTLYISKPTDKKFDDGKYYMGIFESRFENNRWTKPNQIRFTIDIDAYHPVLSVHNDVLFFNSRSDPVSANKSIPHNIWVVPRTSNGWGTPKMVEGVNSLTYDSYPSVAKSNNLYFNSDREGGKGGMDFYVSYFKNGKYQKPINLSEINSSAEENDLVIDPDERFIIFNRYMHDTKTIDMYITFRKNNHWTSPRKLNQINQDDTWELTPTLSPDGQYFFYELNHKIMQIDMNALVNPGELQGDN